MVSRNSLSCPRVSIQLVSPASGDLKRDLIDEFQRKVSIQLVSPASGDRWVVVGYLCEGSVSIQLVSPASGDGEVGTGAANEKAPQFPFNWYPQRVGIPRREEAVQRANRQFPFNWYPQRVGISDRALARTRRPWRFHSIGIPSEWGYHPLKDDFPMTGVFPFNWYPQRVGIC